MGHRHKPSLFFGVFAALCALFLMALSDMVQGQPSILSSNLPAALMIMGAVFGGASLSHFLFDGARSLTRLALAGFVTPALSVTIVCIIFLMPAGLVLLPATMVATGLPLAIPGALLGLAYGLAPRILRKAEKRPAKSLETEILRGGGAGK